MRFCTQFVLRLLSSMADHTLRWLDVGMNLSSGMKNVERSYQLFTRSILSSVVVLFVNSEAYLLAVGIEQNVLAT